ncbi:hypothetical protein KIN20_008626 [Parelaphostrongylus tenuis]|uniref:Uncharacterized protein n=1 Tax=Parelaphostrongylus tenuis TaxID=148309 RepID=A0AAD5QKQ4_PARTN|nr:hypothetical protein KIN20_008626 [Parelaphostrongylus tenuis]
MVISMISTNRLHGDDGDDDDDDEHEQAQNDAGKASRHRKRQDKQNERVVYTNSSEFGRRLSAHFFSIPVEK